MTGRLPLRWTAALAATLAGIGWLSAGTATAAVSNQQDRAVLLCRFPDSPTPSDKTKQYFETGWGAGKGLTGYFEEASYGAIDFSATVYDWQTLPQNRSYYGVTDFNHDLDKLFDDCTGVHNDGAGVDVDFTQFEGIDMIFDENEGFGDGGHANFPTRTLDGVTKVWPSITVSSRELRANNAMIWAHEVGHTFTLPHSVGRESTSHFWSPMATTTAWNWYTANPDPNWFDDNDYFARPTHYLAAEKDLFLGWIPADRRRVVKPGTRDVVNMERLAQPAVNANELIARMPVKGSDPKSWYTVEARKRVGFFDSASNLPEDGILITKVTPCNCNFLQPNQVEVVGVAGSGEYAGTLDFHSALWQPGEAFRENGVKVKVLDEFASGYKVKIANNT